MLRGEQKVEEVAEKLRANDRSGNVRDSEGAAHHAARALADFDGEHAETLDLGRRELVRPLLDVRVDELQILLELLPVGVVSLMPLRTVLSKETHDGADVLLVRSARGLYDQRAHFGRYAEGVVPLGGVEQIADVPLGWGQVRHGRLLFCVDRRYDGREKVDFIDASQHKWPKYLKETQVSETWQMAREKERTPQTTFLASTSFFG